MRRTALKRTKPARFKRRVPISDMARQMWLTDMEPRCAMSGESTCCGLIQGHHVLSKQSLRKRGLTAYLYDRRNRAPLCEMHHRRHTTRHEPMPLRLVPGSAVEMAFELDLLYLLERGYA